MKRTILLLAVLALVSVSTWGQRLSRPGNQYDWQVVRLEKPLHVHIDGNALNNSKPMLVTGIADRVLCEGDILVVKRSGKLKWKHVQYASDGVLIAGKRAMKYAHAQQQPSKHVKSDTGFSDGWSEGELLYPQQQPKEVASAATPKPASGPIDIPFPARENEIMKRLWAEGEKVNKEYDVDGYNKEVKAAQDLYDNAIRTLKTKYKLAERDLKLKPLNDQFSNTVGFAQLDAGLTAEQKTWNPQMNEQHEWVWRKPLEQPKPQGQ